MPMPIILVMLVLDQSDMPAAAHDEFIVLFPGQREVPVGTREVQDGMHVHRDEHDPVFADVEEPTSRALLRIFLVSETLPESGGGTAA